MTDVNPHIAPDGRRLADLCQRWHIRRLAVFGSAIRDDFTSTSDIDLLVEFEPGHTPGYVFFTIESELSALLGRKVDLNTIDSLSRRLRDRVAGEAEDLYVAA